VTDKDRERRAKATALVRELTAEEALEKFREADSATKPKRKPPQLRSFKFDFDGEALGGEAVVISYSAKTALRLLMAAHPGLTGVECKDPPGPATGIVHFWDGDY
jgi:hypothetical protein